MTEVEITKYLPKDLVNIVMDYQRLRQNCLERLAFNIFNPLKKTKGCLHFNKEQSEFLTSAANRLSLYNNWINFGFMSANINSELAALVAKTNIQIRALNDGLCNFRNCHQTGATGMCAVGRFKPTPFQIDLQRNLVSLMSLATGFSF